jgi:YqjK-like protein
MSRITEILERRARLVAEAEAQRQALAEGVAGCRKVFSVADRGLALTHWLRGKPYLAVAATAAVAVLRPRLALGWGAQLLTLWRVGRLLYDVVRPAAARPGPGGG